jgi:hypothetical protein
MRVTSAASRKEKRGQGAAGKVTVWELLKRNGSLTTPILKIHLIGYIQMVKQNML